jgi:hypothetical protein
MGVFVNGTTVYAATAAGLSISTDGGLTFNNNTIINGLGDNQVSGVFANGSTVYAATNGGLSISTDGGATFTNKTTADGLGSDQILGVFVNGTTVYAATDGGLSISLNPPTVAAVNPNSGTTLGGTSITITGTNFTGATSITVGGVLCTAVTVVNSTTATCTTPPGTAGTASVLVTTPGGTNAANSMFMYVAAPTVTSVSPTNGPTAGQTSVTITGSNFGSTTDVKFGSTSAWGWSVISASQITAISDVGTAGTVDITVTNAGGTSATSAADRFTYLNPPTLTSICQPAAQRLVAQR